LKITKTTRICTKCSTEKSVEEFGYVGNGYQRSWCKRCSVQHSMDYYTKQKVGNVKLYGTAHTPEKLRKDREYHARRRAENERLYGTARTPEELEKIRECRATERIRALTLLGSVCTCCGEDRPERLIFDHVNGCGKKFRTRAERVVHEILTMDSPADKYRILCWNCNESLSAYGYCPHNGRPPEEAPANSNQEKAKYARQQWRKDKLKFISEYGERCPICGEDRWEFLTVDHVNGGGKQHRERLRSHGGVNFYRWLKRQGYPKDEYQLLCHNCNGAKEIAKRRR